MIKKLTIKLPILFCIISLLSFTSVHKYYLSLTQVNYVEESQTLQVTTEIFVDDLEKVLRKRYLESINLVEDDTTEMPKYYVSRYIGDKLTIQLDGDEIHPEFLGFEYKEDKIVCYLEAKNVPKFSIFGVNNSILFDMFSKQQNIVKLKVGDIEKSVLLVKDRHTEQIVLNE